jgi:2-polyprenyl-6-methoxyphenol hydroxylase-like FAD-dependent oxidoreductase
MVQDVLPRAIKLQVVNERHRCRGMRADVTENISTDVVIVGGGPVGLSAAADLDARGVRSVVIERREFLEAPNVKCNHVSARTMERWRGLGIADKIRAAGLPSDHPQDVAFRTTLTGTELTRIRIPSRDERSQRVVGPDTTWATPEPPHRVNQQYIEPILMDHVSKLDNVVLLNRTEFAGSTQDEFGVTASVKSASGTTYVRGKYLIGADGARSAVRKQIGAQLSGDAVLSNVQSTCINAPRLYELLPGERAWGYYTMNPRRNGHVYSIDGRGVFLVHNYLTPQEAADDSVDRDRSIRQILGVDEHFEYETISKEDWIARRLVADRFRDRRIFIAGDACHLWVPYAGYGMNAGIADGLNLTWVLGAVINGWADEKILNSYEAERLPITDQVSRFAMSHLQKITQDQIPDDIEDESREGSESRDRIGRTAYRLNVQQFAAAGLNFGYSYDNSPIISYDDEKAPRFTMGSYTPSTVPGCRAPHFWLPDGSSLYDRLGLGYSLVANGKTEVQPFVDAAQEAGVPLDIIEVARGTAPVEYSASYTIVRQDQHVAWRGDNVPSSLPSLMKLLRGELVNERADGSETIAS